METWQGILPTWQHCCHSAPQQHLLQLRPLTLCTASTLGQAMLQKQTVTHCIKCVTSVTTTCHVHAGFMSNRGRQNVASYLVLDMGVDWRKGADWFETVLQDYDVCSNWGNWVSAAGLTGGRINHFNITKQSKVSGCCHS